jgi:hypothetical protein
MGATVIMEFEVGRRLSTVYSDKKNAQCVCLQQGDFTPELATFQLRFRNMAT